MQVPTGTRDGADQPTPYTETLVMIKIMVGDYLGARAVLTDMDSTGIRTLEHVTRRMSDLCRGVLEERRERLLIEQRRAEGGNGVQPG